MLGRFVRLADYKEGQIIEGGVSCSSNLGVQPVEISPMVFSNLVFLICVIMTAVQVTASQTTTIAVGRTSDSATTITVTPTIGQSVELQCIRSLEYKQWYTTGSEVTPTPNEISTIAGATRILAFSSFTPSHAGTYTCVVSSTGNTQIQTTYPVVLVTESDATTIAVGSSTDSTTTITVTPTIGQSVELQCSGRGVGKRWYTTGSEVTPTSNEISTSAGHTRTLAFSSFTPSHAGTYTCLASSKDDTQTKTTYPVVLVNPSAINTIRVGRTDDPTTPITITPTLSQPVELECDRQTTGKNWYTDGTIVTTTPGELATLARAGVKTLSISSFNPSHARGYTCTVNGGTSTAYPVLLVTPPPVPVIPPPSQVQGVMIARNRTSLTVSWTAVTDPMYAILYVVRYSTNSSTRTDPPSDAMKKSGISATLTTLTGLQSDTTYYVWVAAEILGAGVQGPYSKRFPNEASFQVTVTRGTLDGFPFLVISWNREVESGITYIVRYSVDSGTETEPPSEASTVSGILDSPITLVKLAQGTTYYIWVAAVRNGEESPYSRRVSETTYQAPPVVQGVTVIPNVTKISRSPSLIVSWSAPVGDDITYVVLYSTIRLTNPLQGSVEREASCPSIYLTGLTRGTRYYIWVCAVADGLHGPYSTVTMAPTVNIPGSPTVLGITPPSESCDQLMITWKAPSITGGLPVKYKVYANNETLLILDSRNTVTFTGLTANTQYTVRVIAFNDLGDGGEVRGTGKTRPEGLIAVKLSTSFATQIAVDIATTSDSPLDLFSCTIMPNNNLPQSRHITGSEAKYVVDGLRPGVNYTVKCTASLNGIQSCESVSNSLVTPTLPPQIQSISITIPISTAPTLIISWDRIINYDYQVTYTVRYSTSRGTTTEPPSGAPTISGITGTSTAVTELAQGTTYYIWVKAVASVGDGPYSGRTQTRTIRIPNQINMTDVVVVSQYLLWSNWSAPSSERPIQRYEVEYRSVDSGSTDWHRVSMNPITTSAAIENLKPGTTYQVRVRAVSDVGSGEWSIIFSRTTYDDTNECESDNGGCQHICVNTIGLYYCLCLSGYTLHEDGHTCVTNGEVSINFEMIGVSGREGQRLVLAVERIGWMRAPLSVPVSILHLNTSLPNQANEGDYSLLTKELTFNSIYASNERQVVAIDLIEDGNEGEEDELFYVLLHPPPEVQSKTKLVTCVIHVG